MPTLSEIRVFKKQRIPCASLTDLGKISGSADALLCSSTAHTPPSSLIDVGKRGDVFESQRASSLPGGKLFLTHGFVSYGRLGKKKVEQSASCIQTLSPKE